MEHLEIYNLQQKPDIGPAITVFLLCGLTLTGLWIRICGLGERPLARDEYYFIRSVQNILEFGFPRYPDGGYYIRGILPQYLSYFSISLFGEGGFAYRLPSALFGAGTLVMAFFLGRRFLNRSWSILLVGLLTFSSWAIEFSRFARMYAALQFMSVGFFWSFYRYSFDGASLKRYFTVAFALLAVLSHELGVFVALFLFIPFFAWIGAGWRRLLSEQRFYFMVSLAVLLVGLLQAKFPFRLLGVVDPLPFDYMPSAGTPVRWSQFGTLLFGGICFKAIGTLVSAFLLGRYLLCVFRHRLNGSAEEHFLGGLLVLAVCGAVFHQLAVSAVILGVVALREPKLLLGKPYRHLLALLVVIVVFWSALLFLKYVFKDQTGTAIMAGNYLTLFRLSFLSFPDLYLPVIKAWAMNIPVLGSLLAAAGVWQIICIRRLPLTLIVRNPVLPIVIVLMAFGVFPPFDIETRYTHFLYPLALCVGLLSAVQITNTLHRWFGGIASVWKAAALASCLFLFCLTEEVNSHLVLRPNSDSVAYRTGRYEKYSKHWYPRWDFRGPAEFINTVASDGSKIIVISSANTVGAYLKTDYAIYWHREDPRFELISRDGGSRELWSGRRLLSTVQELEEFTQKAETVWVVLYPRWRSLEPAEVWPGRVQGVQVYTPAIDKRIEVWRIDLKEA